MTKLTNQNLMASSMWIRCWCPWKTQSEKRPEKERNRKENETNTIVIMIIISAFHLRKMLLTSGQPVFHDSLFGWRLHSCPCVGFITGCILSLMSHPLFFFFNPSLLPYTILSYFGINPIVRPWWILFECCLFFYIYFFATNRTNVYFNYSFPY